MNNIFVFGSETSSLVMQKEHAVKFFNIFIFFCTVYQHTPKFGNISKLFLYEFVNNSVAHLCKVNIGNPGIPQIYKKFLPPCYFIDTRRFSTALTRVWDLSLS